MILDIPLHNTLWKNGHWSIFVLLCSKNCCYLKSYLDNQDPAWIIWKLSGQSKSFWPKPVLNPLCTLSAAAFHEIRILLSTSCHLMNTSVPIHLNNKKRQKLLNAILQASQNSIFWNSLIGIQFIDFNSFVRNWYCKKIQSHQTILIACMSDYQTTFKILQISFWTISFLVVGLAKRCGGSVSRMSLCRTYCLAISSSKDTIEPLLAIIIHNQDVSDTYNVFLISFKIDFGLELLNATN